MAKKITALSVLTQMDKLHREREAPSIPKNYIVGTKFSDKKANGLEQAIVKFITLSGYQAERIKNVGRQMPAKKIHTAMGTITTGKAIFIPGTGTNGTPDVRATIQGKSVGIEVKIGRDTQSDKQSDYQLSMERAGGIYYIAKDFTSFVKWYVSVFGKSEAIKEAIRSLS